MPRSPAPALYFQDSPVSPAPSTAPETRFHDWFWELAAGWSAKILGTLLLLVAAWLVSSWARRAVGKLLDRPFIDKTVVRFAGNIVRWIVLLLGLLSCLGLFGVNVTSVAAVIGAAGLAIGLALQGSLSNLAAGVMLLVLRPFKIGDLIQFGSQLGRVDDIDLFHTKLDTGDNRRLVVPNSSLFTTVIENHTHHAWRRCDVPVGVAYQSDLLVARAALRRAGEAMPKRQPDKPVDVLLQGLGNSAIEWVVRVWVPSTELVATRDLLLMAIKRELDAVGVAIPFPQMDVWVRERRAEA